MDWLFGARKSTQNDEAQTSAASDRYYDRMNSLVTETEVRDRDRERRINALEALAESRLEKERKEDEAR
jgi:hypothetical protein